MVDDGIKRALEGQFAIYTSVGLSGERAPTSLHIRLRCGPTTVTTRHPSQRWEDGVQNSRRRFYLSVNPQAVADAWAALGTRVVGTAVLLKASVFAMDPGLGPIYAWSGAHEVGWSNCYKQSLVKAEGYAIRVGGAVVSGDSTERAIAMAHRVRDLGGAIDWSKVRIWTPHLAHRLSGMVITNVAAYGSELRVIGHLPGFSTDEPNSRRLDFHRVEQAPDGSWVSTGSVPAYEKWKVAQVVAMADLDALEAM